MTAEAQGAGHALVEPVAREPGLAAAQRRSFLWDLGPRLASGVVMVAVALVTAWAGGAWFVLFWLAAAVAVLAEWQAMVGGPAFALRMALGGGALAIGAGCTLAGAPEWGWPPLVAAALAVNRFSSERRRWSTCGVLYAGALLVAVTTLRSSAAFGFEAVVWLFAVVWGNDTIAYFAGRLIGGPKLWRRVSPSKTWSGSVAGMIGGAAAGVAVAPAMSSLPYVVVLGLCCAVAAQAGDLFELAMKRRFGVKDSSHIIPGHGGAMDRLDGFTAAALLAVVIGVGRAGFDASAVGLFIW